MVQKKLWEKVLGLFKKEDFIKNIRLFDGDVHLHFHFYLRPYQPNSKEKTRMGVA